MNKHTKLKPCPFCGKTPDPAEPVEWECPVTFVICMCGATGPVAKNRQAAHRAWNRRKEANDE